MSGGGGYGDPLLRDPQRVLEDIRDAKVSVQAAADQYGVVVTDGRIDTTATDAARTEMRDRRGPITWTFDRGPLGKE